MKILVVLTLLLSLCTAYEDWTLDSIANATQSEGYYPDSPGTCTISQTYTSADNTLAGTFTCTGLKANLTGVHIHDVTKSYTVTTNTGAVLTDCPIMINADAASGTFTCAFKDTLTMDAICNDQCYWNFHTDYDTLGEVRANLVNMRPLCNVKGGVALNGEAVTVGSAPSTGIEVADFYAGFIATTTVGTGGGYVYISWDSVAQVVTVSGCTYGLTSDVYDIYMYYTDDDSSSYFYTVATSTFPSGRPFSFRSYYSLSDWDVAKMTSGKAYIVLETYTNTAGELQFDLNSDDFPAFDTSCRPYTGLKYDSTAVLTCQYGSDSYSTEYDCSAGYFCSISSLDTKSCTSLEYCYECDCGASDTDLPLSGYACCDFSNCNKLSLAFIGCISGAESISSGLLVSLFVALFMKWFN
jgi:hypothetical protein